MMQSFVKHAAAVDKFYTAPSLTHLHVMYAIDILVKTMSGVFLAPVPFGGFDVMPCTGIVGRRANVNNNRLEQMMALFSYPTNKNLRTAAMLMALLGFSLLSSMAQASLMGQSISVTFREDTFPDSVSNVTVVNPGYELQFGDASQMDQDGLILEGEYIDVDADTIAYHIRGGAGAYAPDQAHAVADPTLYSAAGFGPTAKLIFTFPIASFAPDLPAGVIIDLFGLTGVTNDDVTFTNDTVTIALGNIGVRDLGGLPDYGTLMLSLQLTAPPEPPPSVPEPGTLALLGLGLGALGLRRRAKRHAA